MKRLYTVFIFSIVLLLAGCNLNINEDPLRTEVSIDSAEVGAHVDGLTLPEVAAFQFDSVTIDQIETPVQGRVSVPEEEGLYPVVFIVHGVHPDFDRPKRYDAGFDHVLTHLAARGIVAVSIDANAIAHDEARYAERLTALVRRHVTEWEARQKGQKPSPLPVKGKMDFQKIGLLGYSEGGDAIVDVATRLKEEGRKVESILAVAPIVQKQRKTWPLVDIGILVPEYDYVAPNYDGIVMYDTIPNDHDRLKVVTFLEKANHTYFNRAIETNDVVEHGTNYELKHQLEREKQEEFLRQYAADYFYGTLNRAETSLLRILETRPQPNLMYWHDVTLRAQLPQSISIMPNKNEAFIERMEKEAEAVDVALVRDAADPKKDDILVDTVTALHSPVESRTLLSFVWSKKGATVELKPTRDNFIGAQVISIDFLVDPSNRNNQKVDFQNFGIEIEDTHGNVTRAALPEEQNAMRVVEGGVEMIKRKGGKEEKRWSKKTPLVSVRIPLDRFDTIDFENVAKVRFYFNGHDKGAIYVEDIYIQ